MNFYNNINSLYLECTCIDIEIQEWNKLMKKAKRGNKYKIDNLVKILLPNLYTQLSLQYYNPYNYFKTKTHLILVHSNIEYFLKIN